jgi:dihydrofolate reductase
MRHHRNTEIRRTEKSVDENQSNGAPGRLVINMFMTLDGVMQAPGGPDEDTEGGFTHGGWQAAFVEEEAGKLILDELLEMDALLLGRKTYEIFSNYWPQAPADNPIAAHFNRTPKYVASRSEIATDWVGTTLIQDVARDVIELKRTHREIRVIGSADLLQTLLALDLVDGLNLWMYPATLGSGKRVFQDGAIPAAFELAAPPVGFTKGSVLLSYRRAGDLTYGDMGAE